MTSKRVRKTTSLGNRLSAIQTGMANLEAQNRAPAPDPELETVENLRQQVALLLSANWRIEQEQPIWDARYDTRYLPETLRASLMRRGTTAERNALWPTPATDPDRVALANQKIVWFNTDLGWEESYYAVTGLSGLTARGLDTGTASGWYPTSKGPKIVLNPGATASFGAGSNISGWSSTEWHRGDPANLVYSGGIVTVAMPGRYRVRWRTTLQVGAGALDMWLYAGSTFANDAWDLNGSFYKQAEYEFSDVPLSAGDTTRAKINNGGPINIHISSSTHRGEYVVEYIGPRLTSD